MKDGLHQLFINELADVYNAERQLIKTLPKLAKNAEMDELREAFEAHLKETENHVSRLDQIFESLDESPKRKKCKGMEGVIDEGKEMLDENKGTPTADAALISAAQKAEHYEIATYGTLCTWAEVMGHGDALKLLKQTLAEETATDEKLSSIAKSTANMQAQEA